MGRMPGFQTFINDAFDGGFVQRSSRFANREDMVVKLDMEFRHAEEHDEEHDAGEKAKQGFHSASTV